MGDECKVCGAVITDDQRLADKQGLAISYHQGCVEILHRRYTDLAPFVALVKAVKVYLAAQEERRKHIESLKGKELEDQSFLRWVLRCRDSLADALAHPAVQRVVK